MLKEISLAQLTMRADSPTRMSRQTAKKLRRSIEEIGRYEAVVVRPRANARGDAGYEILNGHARIDALRAMGKKTARCDVWELGERETRLFLAARDGVRGETVPELRIDLLLALLEQFDAPELAELVSENESYLRQLLRLRDSVEREERGESTTAGRHAVSGTTGSSIESRSTGATEPSDRVPLTVMLTRPQYAAVDRGLRDYMATHRLSDAGAALERILVESASDFRTSTAERSA